MDPLQEGHARRNSWVSFMLITLDCTTFFMITVDFIMIIFCGYQHG